MRDDSPAPARSGDPSLDESWRGHGAVLVVEDERRVQEVVREMLQKAGFSVLVAANGREGVATFTRHRDEVTLVLLDMTMPHMGGQEAFGHLRQLAPGVPVILATGYEEQDVVSRFADKGPTGLIHKPFERKTLLRAVRQALERSGPTC